MKDSSSTPSKTPKQSAPESKDSAKAGSAEGLQKKLDEAMDGWKRSRADYQNLQKRTLEDVVKARQQGKSGAVLELLPVVDNVQAALGSVPEDLQDHPWTKGVQYVSQQFESFLNEQGLKEIKVGKVFDPMQHEAVKTVPIGSDEVADKKPGEIVSVSRKGYLLGDQVLRPAGVVVVGDSK